MTELFYPTIRQIAHLCVDPFSAVLAVDKMAMLGFDEWITDEADLDGLFYDPSGQPHYFRTRAFMAFNYQAHSEHELEFLAYQDGNHYRRQLNGWHEYPDSPPRITHVSIKSEDSAADGEALAEQLDTRIVCKFRTGNHLNPALLEQGRTFSETIVDTTPLFGYDVKFIQSVYER